MLSDSTACTTKQKRTCELQSMLMLVLLNLQIFTVNCRQTNKLHTFNFYHISPLAVTIKILKKLKG